MKRILLLGALCMNALVGFACDQCGCGLLLGIQPFDRSSYFGLQFRMRYMHGDLLNDAGLNSTVTEVYYALEARGQFWLSDRFSLTAAVPLVNNYQGVDGVRMADVYAVGDPLIMGRYVLFNTRSVADSARTLSRTRQRLTVGLGAKLPLAKNDVSQYGNTVDDDLQPGTGTWDALTSLEYLVRGKHWGFGIGANGRINGKDSNGAQRGNALNITAEIFRTWSIGKAQWTPSVGGYTEMEAQDRDNGTPVDGSGGTTFFSHVGSRVWLGSIGFSIAWQHALLRDEGALNVPNRERFLAGITYHFNHN